MLPACYDEFRNNKLYKCLEHPTPQGDRVFVTVPFTDKDEFKRLGGRWGLGQTVNEQTMSIGEVSYTREQADALFEWAESFKKWWYWSNAVVRDDLHTEDRLKFIEQVHSRSAFSHWEVDRTTMMRVWDQN
jgi:hypothetical protein